MVKVVKTQNCPKVKVVGDKFIRSSKECALSEEKRALMKKIINDRKAALDALAKY